jgi:bacillopeptidase F (M6 metalloprotease family)
VKQVFCGLAIDRCVAKIDKNQVHLSATGQYRYTVAGNVGLGQTLSNYAGSIKGALLAVFEFWAKRSFEGHSLGGDNVHQRATLLTRENRRVDLLGVFLFAKN